MEQPPIRLDMHLDVSETIKAIAIVVIVFLYVDLSFKITRFVVKYNTAYD